MSEISTDKCSWEQNGEGSYGGIKLRYQSRALSSLTDLFYLVSDNQKRKVNKAWLENLSPLSLTLWWLDDGSLVSNSRKGVFCTDNFSYEDLLMLKGYLKEVWNVETAVSMIRKKYFRLWIYSTDELKKFLRLILPYIPVKEMLPKVLILYKDPILQQRWISEVCSLSNFDKATVEKIVLERKKDLKLFRE